ncbi:hypothetical protein [Vibrio owensii]|uniref:hypothetical protein n=1 Tax=Vibrio owensii TaxID=696485 RepID=UPI0018F1E29F|nr:hypothetical protein [Vibrio owensii]
MCKLTIRLKSLMAIVFEDEGDIQNALKPCLFVMTDGAGVTTKVHLYDPVVDFNDWLITYDLTEAMSKLESDGFVESTDFGSMSNLDVMLSFSVGSPLSAKWRFEDAVVTTSSGLQYDVGIYSKFHFLEYVQKVSGHLRSQIGDIKADGFKVTSLSFGAESERQCYESYRTGFLSLKLEEAVRSCLVDELPITKITSVCGLRRNELLELV